MSKLPERTEWSRVDIYDLLPDTNLAGACLRTRKCPVVASVWKMPGQTGVITAQPSWPITRQRGNVGCLSATVLSPKPSSGERANNISGRACQGTQTHGNAWPLIQQHGGTGKNQKIGSQVLFINHPGQEKTWISLIQYPIFQTNKPNEPVC